MLRPLNSLCFIEPDWDEEKKIGSIFLPNVRQRELPNTGIVKAVANGSDFKVGDHVIYDRHKQQLRDVPGFKNTLTIVKLEDVIAIIP